MNNEDAYHLFVAYDESGRVKSIFDNSGAYDTVMEENNTIEITVGERDALVLSPDGFRAEINIMERC